MNRSEVPLRTWQLLITSGGPLVHVSTVFQVAFLTDDMCSIMEAEDAGGINGRDVRRCLSLWRRTSVKLERSVLANQAKRSG
jgi:hypothetical protein